MPGRRHPLAIYLLGLCVTAGAGSLAGRTQPQEIEAALPDCCCYPATGASSSSPPRRRT